MTPVQPKILSKLRKEFPLQSYPRIYGSRNIFSEIVNQIKVMLIVRSMYWITKQELAVATKAPVYLVG